MTKYGYAFASINLQVELKYGGREDFANFPSFLRDTHVNNGLGNFNHDARINSIMNWNSLLKSKILRKAGVAACYLVDRTSQEKLK